MFLGIYVHYDRMHCQCLQVVSLQFGQNFFFFYLCRHKLCPLLLWCLTLEAPITTAADNIHKYCFSEKIRLDVSSESSAEDSHEKSSLIFLER